MLGYTCYGPIALTAGSYDLYWIAVDKSTQGLGLGRTLLEKSEQIIRQEGGRRIYIETSTRPPYAPTRAFYERSGLPPGGRVGRILRSRRRQGDLRESRFGPSEYQCNASALTATLPGDTTRLVDAAAGPAGRQLRSPTPRWPFATSRSRSRSWPRGPCPG